MLLCLATAHYFNRQGAHSALCTTSTDRLDLPRLYRRMGARELGLVPYDPPQTIFVFDLEDLLDNPLARQAGVALGRKWTSNRGVRVKGASEVPRCQTTCLKSRT